MESRGRRDRRNSGDVVNNWLSDLYLYQEMKKASFGHAAGTGLFVPKPTNDADCQGCGVLDLGSVVHQRRLASVADGNDRYSLGYSVRVDSRGALWLDHLIRSDLRARPLLARTSVDLLGRR
jgi:hypothetical protein